MSRFQDLKDLLERRLLTAVSRDMDPQRTQSANEEELQRQRELLDVILIPEIKLHRADIQQLLVCKEEQQETSFTLDQEETKNPDFKEEQEEKWSTQGREQLEGLDGADPSKLLFSHVPVKSDDDDEERPLPFLQNQRPAEQMGSWVADEEDCGGSEVVVTSDSEIGTENSSDLETDDSDHWKKTRGHHSDVQLVIVKKEELPPEQQERSPYPDQEENESPLIKEEEEELWIGQGREQLQGLEEADTKFLFTSVHMKSENDEEKPESSLLHQRLTDHMETAAGGEDCGRPEPDRSSDPERNVQPENEVQTETSSGTGSGTEDEADDWKETRDGLKRLKSATNKRAKTVKSHNCPEPDETNDVVSLTEKRPFSCSECGKGFSLKVYLGRHMFVHTKQKPYSCSDCGKCFTRRGNLKRHLFVHTEEKPFSCAVCGKAFTQKADLGRHMIVHTKEKGFSCSECGKEFNHKGNLTRHVFIHSKEKLFSCFECGKRFNHKSSLTKHMFIHTNQKPFSCSECGRCFRQRGSLKRHLFVHSKEKPFSCAECGKLFAQKADLRRHMFVHTKEKGFRCSRCGKRFYHKVRLITHDCMKLKDTTWLL